jgi:hypothetical protein
MIARDNFAAARLAPTFGLKKIERKQADWQPELTDNNRWQLA